MRHAGPYGSMVAGLCALLFATGAVYGVMRLVVGGGVALAVAAACGGLVALWVAAYFSGDGHSVRRAVNGWWLAAGAGAAISTVLWAVGRLDPRWALTAWVVAWMFGACVAVGSAGRAVAAWRVAAVVVLGVPAAIGAVAAAGLPVVGIPAGVALLAAPLSLADAVATRGTA